MNTDGFRPARPGAERDRAQQIAMDFAQYSSVVVLLGTDPDNPGTVRRVVTATPGGPCFHLIAQALRELAQEFEECHRGDGCI
jgi:hypothetical protein